MWLQAATTESSIAFDITHYSKSHIRLEGPSKMDKQTSSRRTFLKLAGAGASSLALSPAWATARETVQPGTLAVGSEPQYDLSPYLYMQFMEPLGTTDGSVAAAWDFFHDRWRADVIDITKQLGPTMMRWGGCFSSYYRWKEAVGPATNARPCSTCAGAESKRTRWEPRSS